MGCSPWGHEELDTTERLHFHFSLSCIGGGNGNPLQCSCLENPRDRGAWWAAMVSALRVHKSRVDSMTDSLMASTNTHMAGGIFLPGVLLQILFS